METAFANSEKYENKSEFPETQEVFKKVFVE